MKQFKAIIWGLAIIALGVIFGGHALGLFNFNIFFDGWWALFIIVPSAISLITDKDKMSNLFMLAVGVILLLAAQGVFGEDSWNVAWKVILAVFLISLGLWIVVKGVFHSNNDKEVEKKIRKLEDEKTMESLVAIFSGSDRVYNDEVFTGATIAAVFGGAELDLKRAKFTKDTVIKAFCLFGGIDIKVPEDVQVKIKSGFIFGGASDDRKGETGKGKYVIYIDCAGGFGGISISDKAKKK